MEQNLSFSSGDILRLRKVRRNPIQRTCVHKGNEMILITPKIALQRIDAALFDRHQSGINSLLGGKRNGSDHFENRFTAN